jgi:GNAT superfamily N-acetyltransferase
MEQSEPDSYTFHWLTPERWADLEGLFGPKGAVAGCWCMYWRLPAREFDLGSGAPLARDAAPGTVRGARNRAAFRGLVESGARPGILAYAGGRAVGWMALAPREEYIRLEHSRVMAPVDAEPVWSITCFFVEKAWRRRGLTVALLGAAADMARQRGASVLEGYPVEPKQALSNDSFVFTGLASAFRQAGFHEAARRSETRPIMRLRL